MSKKLLLVGLLITLIGNSCALVEKEEPELEAEPEIVAQIENPEIIEQINQPKIIEQRKELVKFDTKKLSGAGKIAYERLLNAQEFQDTRIGIAGTLSSLVESFGILLKEKKADEAFKALLKNAYPAGQLYALCGVYFTDYKFFLNAAKKYQESSESIKTLSGCSGFEAKVSEIVEKTDPKVAIINPSQTYQDFLKKAGQDSFYIDIIHGGYPAKFKHFAIAENKKL